MEEYVLMVSTPTLALAKKATPARIALQVGFIILKKFCFRKINHRKSEYCIDIIFFLLL